MKKSRILTLIMTVGLLILVIGIGPTIALMKHRSEGLAWTDLSDVSVQVMAAATQKPTLYAVQTGGHQPAGFYRSDDGGRRWENVCSGPGMAIRTLAINPRDDMVVYAGSDGSPMGTLNGIWRSVDGGHTWYEFNSNLPADSYGRKPTITALTVDPEQPEVLYVGTAGQGVYRFDETRSGYEWLGGADSNRAFVQTIVVGPGSRVYALIDYRLYEHAEAVWQELEPIPDQAVSLAVAPGDSQIVYVGSSATGVYRSDNGGRSWEHISHNIGLVPGAPLQVTTLAVDKHDPEHVAAGTAYLVGSQLVGGGIFESVNGGRWWAKLDDVEGLVSGLYIDSDGIQAATSRGMQRYIESNDPSPIDENNGPGQVIKAKPNPLFNL